MSNQGIKILLILFGGLIVIGILVYWLIPTGDESLTGDQTPLPAKVDLPQEQVNAVKLPPPTQKELDAQSGIRIAKTFVERFGTYSNTNGYFDFESVSKICTDTMVSWLKTSYLAQLKKDYPANGFSVVMATQAPAGSLVSQSDGAMTVRVSATRQETKGDKISEPFLQDIIVELKKIDAGWFVDAAFWQKK